MFEFYDYVANTINDVLSYFNSVDTYFHQLIIYLNTWWIKQKLWASVYFLKISYHTAVALLDEIGFNYVFSKLFNQLPSELRYYAHLFKVPEGLGIFSNCAATALVMRMSK